MLISEHLRQPFFTKSKLFIRDLVIHSDTGKEILYSTVDKAVIRHIDLGNKKALQGRLRIGAFQKVDILFDI